METGQPAQQVSRDLTPELRGALPSLVLMLPFVVFVLLEGRVTLSSYLGLVEAFVSIALAVAAGAVLLFSFGTIARTALREGFEQRPLAVLATALGARWRRDRLLSLAWPVATFLVLVPAFNAFKQRILPLAGFHLDPTLAAADRRIFGTDPGAWLHQTFGSVTVTKLLDGVYHSWFVPTTLGVCVVAMLAGTRTRAQYMLAYCGVWIFLGSVLAWLFPAAGPAFYERVAGSAGAAPFQEVHSHLVAAGGSGMLGSIGNQDYVWQHLDAPGLVIGGGISAIPSVHNAMATLFALVAFRAGRLPGVVFTCFAGLIWVASVYLNWHYAVDGAAGIAGALLLWWLAGRVVDLVLPATADREPRPRQRRRPSEDPAHDGHDPQDAEDDGQQAAAEEELIDPRSGASVRL